jgi:hypothetical protein
MKTLKDRSNRMAGMIAVSLNMVGTYTTTFRVTHTTFGIFLAHAFAHKNNYLIKQLPNKHFIKTGFSSANYCHLLVTKFLVSKNPKISLSLSRHR